MLSFELVTWVLGSQQSLGDGYVFDPTSVQSKSG